MAEVKDLENVEQEATAPAMEETAADSAAPAETRVNLKARLKYPNKTPSVLAVRSSISVAR